MKKFLNIKQIFQLFLVIGASVMIFTSCKDEPAPIVNGFVIHQPELALLVGGTDSITATVWSEQGANRTITWTTSNSTVAEVVAGRVYAFAAGTATITARAGDRTASSEVTVYASPQDVPVTGITLNKTAVSLFVEERDTLAATLLPAIANGKTIIWTTSDASVATVVDGEVIAINAGTATITARADDKTATCVVTVLHEEAKVTDPGVVINGVKWATRNIDIPGTFALTSESTGMLYQWNRKVGWNLTEPIQDSNGGTVWNATMPAGTTWEPENDPSPAGWRVPTIQEMRTLLDATSVKRELVTREGVIGFLFTDIESEESLFLPAAGNRVANGSFEALGNWAAYLSSSQDDALTAMYVGFWTPGGGGVMEGTTSRVFANPVRSVAE